MLGPTISHATVDATKTPIPTNVKEHRDYGLVYRVGNGLLPEHRRWANINPLTVTKINGQNV